MRDCPEWGAQGVRRAEASGELRYDEIVQWGVQGIKRAEGMRGELRYDVQRGQGLDGPRTHGRTHCSLAQPGRQCLGRSRVPTRRWPLSERTK